MEGVLSRRPPLFFVLGLKILRAKTWELPRAAPPHFIDLAFGLLTPLKVYCLLVSRRSLTIHLPTVKPSLAAKSI